MRKKTPESTRLFGECAIIHAAEVARQRLQAERIYRKIEQGCHDRRLICKNTGINAECRPALLEISLGKP